MKWRYKTVMFLTLLIFCIGSVCATDQDTTDPFVKKLIDDNHQLNTKVYNQSIEIKNLAERLDKKDVEIQNLKDNNTQLDKRIKTLEDSNNQLNNTVNNQNVIINSLKEDNKVLTDSNKVLTDRVQALEYSKLTQSNRIKSLEINIKNLDETNNLLVDSNRVLNNTVNNQSVIINELNNKLELQFIEINKLQGDKDKLQSEIKQLNIDIKQLNAEKCSIYEKLLNSPKKEDYEQLKKDIKNKNKDITNKDNLINELNTKIDNLNKEIKTLKAIYTVSKNDVYNSLKALSSTNIQNIKCGQYTFKLEDYLKIPLIKNGKNDIIKFKKDNGRLPKYVMIAGYKVPQNVYQKLYNL